MIIIKHKGYCYMAAHKGHNRFRKEYAVHKGYYDWSLEAPEIYKGKELEFAIGG